MSFTQGGQGRCDVLESAVKVVEPGPVKTAALQQIRQPVAQAGGLRRQRLDGLRNLLRNPVEAAGDVLQFLRPLNQHDKLGRRDEPREEVGSDTMHDPIGPAPGP